MDGVIPRMCYKHGTPTYMDGVIPRMCYKHGTPTYMDGVIPRMYTWDGRCLPYIQDYGNYNPYKHRTNEIKKRVKKIFFM